jgi:hypothetical protein
VRASNVILTVAVATYRDLVRRPTAAVGALAMGALLAMLPRLGNPAAGLRDNAALAAELTWSTLLAAAAVVAGLTTLHVLRRPGGGLEPEVRALPLEVDAVLTGRTFGVSALVLSVLGVAGLLGGLGWIGVPTPSDVQWMDLGLFVGLGLPAAAILGSALGALASVVLPGDLAVVALVGWVVLARWGTALAPDAWWGWIVPDPSRLDVARDLAFGRPVGVTFLLASAAAALLHAAFAHVLAAWALRGTRRPQMT